MLSKKETTAAPAATDARLPSFHDLNQLKKTIRSAKKYNSMD